MAGLLGDLVLGQLWPRPDTSHQLPAHRRNGIESMKQKECGENQACLGDSHCPQDL